MEQRDLGEIFLVSFLHSIAMVSKPSPDFTEAIEIQNQPKEMENRVVIEMLPQGIKGIKNNTAGKHIIEINEYNNFRPQSPQRRFTQNTAQQRYQNTNSQQMQNTNAGQKSASEKLSFLIKDPAVTEIECIGSEQNILVKKAGVVQKTPVRLSIEEVYELIAEFSQKTKIPVIDGTIKAALNNLILTAVLSEMLGPRFILQKKNPFQQLVQN